MLCYHLPDDAILCRVERHIVVVHTLGDVQLPQTRKRTDKADELGVGAIADAVEIELLHGWEQRERTDEDRVDDGEVKVPESERCEVLQKWSKGEWKLGDPGMVQRAGMLVLQTFNPQFVDVEGIDGVAPEALYKSK